MNRTIALQQRAFKLLSIALIITCSSLIPLSANAQSDLARKSLMITDLSVVENSNHTSINPCFVVPSDNASQKKWNFGYLMTQASSPNPTSGTASTFVKHWLDTWINPANLYDKPSVTVAPLKDNQGTPMPTVANLIQEDWGAKSNGDPIDSGFNDYTFYNMDYAPFILTAIVPRFDLRKKRRFNEGLAGELRFIFTPVRLRDGVPAAFMPADGACDTAGDNTVILEYAVDKANENEVRNWANAWYQLSELQMGSAAYISRLVELTDSVVKAGQGGDARPNRSELIRIRTNEHDNHRINWRFREWVIDSDTGLPEPVTVKQSPANEMRPGNPNLTWWLGINDSKVMNDSHTIPLGFRGGFDTLELGSAGTWTLGMTPQSSSQAKELRHQFAMGTCAGCHNKETEGGQQFAHINPREIGTETVLSNFLTGNDGGGGVFFVQDPVDPSITRTFNELEKRTSDLFSLVYGWGQTPEDITDPKLVTFFKLPNAESGKCLDIGGNFNGAQLQQWDCHGGANQRFALMNVGGGYYRLQVKQATSVCLQSDTAGAVTQQPCSNNSYQQVAMTSHYGVGYRFQFRNTGKCLDIKNYSNGNNIYQNTCKDGWSSQLFNFIE